MTTETPAGQPVPLHPQLTLAVLGEVRSERAAQDAKWGEQNHPDGTGGRAARIAAVNARSACQEAAERGAVTWMHILREEVREAFAEEDQGRLREELAQVAAVAVGWIEHIDRRSGKTTPAVPALSDPDPWADLEQDAPAADATCPPCSRSKTAAELLGEMRQLRAALSAWRQLAEDDQATNGRKFQKLEAQLAGARGRAVSAESAREAEWAAHKHTRQREEVARERADKAVALLGDLFDELTPRGAEPLDLLRPYLARFAELRAGAEEVQSNG